MKLLNKRVPEAPCGLVSGAYRVEMLMVGLAGSEPPEDACVVLHMYDFWLGPGKEHYLTTARREGDHFVAMDTGEVISSGQTIGWVPLPGADRQSFISCSMPDK